VQVTTAGLAAAPEFEAPVGADRIKMAPMALRLREAPTRAAPAAVPTRAMDPMPAARRPLTFGPADDARLEMAKAGRLDLRPSLSFESGASASRTRMALALPGDLRTPVLGYPLPPAPEPAPAAAPRRPERASPERIARASARPAEPGPARSAAQRAPAAPADLARLERAVEDMLRDHLRGD
jgi:hypothetical protein